ncbi:MULTISPECIES: toxin [unclassified Rickettsia]|uniref:toxin n=1 Tax=unclassified Rickettsia TaxID=114295 RepID=UPI00209E80F9|nr:toxin [Rickettsia endosymbiont of Ceutorhynchus assimilis]
MKIEFYFAFNPEKNITLLKERGISFEQIIALIEENCILDIIDRPNQSKYPNQKIYIIEVDGYCYLVPCIINGKEIFLKTIIPSRKATENYLKIKDSREQNEKI